MKKLLAVPVIVLFSGCAYMKAGHQLAQEAADEAAKVSLISLCDGTTMGAARREWGSPEKLEAACRSLRPGEQKIGE